MSGGFFVLKIMKYIMHGNTSLNSERSVGEKSLYLSPDFSGWGSAPVITSGQLKPTVKAPEVQGPVGPPAGYRKPTPQPAPTGDILGVNNFGGGGGRIPTNNAPVPTGDNGNNAEPNFDAELDRIYNDAMGNLAGAESNLRSGYEGDVALTEKRTADQIGRVQGRGDDLLGQTAVSEERFGKVIQSALSEAVRAFNALDQQRRAKFGGGSSAGGAVGELAQQEFFRQQGDINNKAVEGSEDFAFERKRIGDFVAESIGDLENYKLEALGELKKQFNNGMQEINSRKSEVAANRSRDKMALLQDTVSRARAIQDQDRQIRLGLGTQAIEKMQEIAGRAFTPAEIQATLSEFGINISALGGSAGSPTTPTAQFRQPTMDDDEFTTLG